MKRQEELRQEIKLSEQKFLKNIEEIIKSQYSVWLHDKYLTSLNSIKDCYGNANFNLNDSHKCAKEFSKKYLNLEWHYERILKKYEDGITHCINNCTKEFQPVCFFVYS